MQCYSFSYLLLEIRTERVAMKTPAQERTAMYQHDIEIGKGASQWVINLRASGPPNGDLSVCLLVNRG